MTANFSKAPKTSTYVLGTTYSQSLPLSHTRPKTYKAETGTYSGTNTGGPSSELVLRGMKDGMYILVLIR